MEKLANIPLGSISIPENHLRVQSINLKSVKKLADSILAAGLLVRIIVRPEGKDRYELVDGERRLRAYQLLLKERGERWKEIPANIREMSAREAVGFQVAINENRRDLTPFEKAKGCRMAWETGLFHSHRDLASLIGIGHAEVTRSINIFKVFPREIIQGFETGKLKQAHLLYFYRLPDRQAMRKLYSAITKSDLNSEQTRELANKLDERWLSGDRELLGEIADKVTAVKNLLGTEIMISDLVNKSKCTLIYSNLTRFKELVSALADLVKSGVFHTTLAQYTEKQ